MKVNQQEIDLGTLKLGVPKSFKYTLTNTSAVTVNIDRVVLGCMACTTAQIGKKVLEPGESTDIEAVFTPGSTGFANKTMSVLYDKKELKLKFKAKVDG